MVIGEVKTNLANYQKRMALHRRFRIFRQNGKVGNKWKKKDLIVTSGGDNISVQKIETKLSEQVEIEQAVVFGDNKPFLIALP